ncbi:hypothetical protein NE865_03710 [Phthorimaea operculella]|nr:hypothetical protein NE865_03710 [Phthorimaea operculella]
MFTVHHDSLLTAQSANGYVAAACRRGVYKLAAAGRTHTTSNTDNRPSRSFSTSQATMMRGIYGVVAVAVTALMVCCSAYPHPEQDVASAGHSSEDRYDANAYIQNQEMNDLLRLLMQDEARVSSHGLGGTSLLGRNLNGLGGSSLLGRNLNGLGGSSLLGRNLDGIGGTSILGRDAERYARFVDSLGGGNLVRNLDSIGGGNLVRNLDSIGGGNLVRNLDSLGGGNLVKKNLDSIGGPNLVKRFVDSLGGGNLVRNLDSLGGGNLVRSVNN